MKLKNLKIKMKLLLSFGLIISFLIMISLLSLINTEMIKTTINNNNQLNELMEMTKQKEIDHLSWANKILSGINKGRLTRSDIETDYKKCAFGKWYYSDERNKAVLLAPSIKDAIINIENPHKKLHESAEKIINAIENNKSAAVHEIFMNETEESLVKVRTELAKINDLVKSQSESSAVLIFRYIHQVQIITLALSVAALFIAVILSLLVSGGLTRSVAPILNFAKKLAEGDFTDRIKADHNDEMGQIAHSLDKSADELERLILEIVTTSQNLAMTVQEIAGGNENLSQRTSEQAASLEEIASTIEETTATIRQNADNTLEVSRLTEVTFSYGEESHKISNDTIKAINDVDQSSNKISDIITVINEISFQTNLLALNAAVEAARAGEAGRGFAVVAGEVRNLAQRAASSSREIGDLINDSSDKVGKGTMLVKKGADGLTEILENMKKTGDLIKEITAASEEQKQSMEQISTAIMDLDSMTQQNAALVEETASASEEMATRAQELLAMVKRFKINAENVS